MASTDQVRRWYHSGVVLNHHQRGSSGYEPVCNHSHPPVSFPRERGGFFNEPVHPLCKEAFEAYAQVMRHHGETMPSDGGVNNCRNIGTSDRPSLHAYLCAIDLPPNSRKSAAFLANILKIKTNSGARVFRNLSGDRMHDQIDCSPTAMATGIDWDTVAGEPNGDEDMEKTNKAIQKQCNAGGFKGANGLVLTVDGIIGPNTQHAMNSLAVAAAQNPVPGPKGDPGPRGLRGPKGDDGDSKPVTLTITADAQLP